MTLLSASKVSLKDRFVPSSEYRNEGPGEYFGVQTT